MASSTSQLIPYTYTYILSYTLHYVINYSQDLVSLSETSEFNVILSNRGVTHPNHVLKYCFIILIDYRSHKWSSQSNRAQTRSSEVHLSHRGASQGDEAHVSGAEAHVAAPKTRNFVTEARAHVQRRTPLYRGATPLWRGASLYRHVTEAPASVVIRRTPLRRGARLCGPKNHSKMRKWQKTANFFKKFHMNHQNSIKTTFRHA